MLTFICEDWLFELLIERAMTYSVGVTRQLRRVVNAINVSGRFECASCLPIDSLRQSAVSGCPLCRVLAAGIELAYADDLLSPEIRACQPTRLERAKIDPEQGFDLCIGVDDINHVFFYFVLPSFSTLRVIAMV